MSVFFGFKMGVRDIDKIVELSGNCERTLVIFCWYECSHAVFFVLCSVADRFVTPFIILMKAVKCSQNIGSPC